MTQMDDVQIIKYLIKKAKELGYNDYRYYLMEIIHKKWNNDDIIFELYDSYVKACANQLPKAFSEGVWSKNDTFEDFVEEAEKTVIMRLEQLEKERLEKPESFAGLRDQLPKAELVIEKADEPPTIEIYEFLEEILRRTLEAIRNWKRGDRKVPNKASWM
ncbi:MAG: hypothetical protein ABIM32_03925 [candidate division WOR-3 bacterium]